MSATNEKSENTNNKQFSKHTAEFRDKTSDLGHDFQDLGRITNSLCTDAAHMAQNNVTNLYDQGKKQAGKLSKNIEKQIQQKPIQSLLIAAGVGLALGKIWSRR